MNREIEQPETLGMSRPDLVCPECGSADHVIETPDHDQTALCCLQTIARCWDCQVYWYASPYHRVPSPHSAPPQICDHQWTDLYTDRDSPQSYESGQYGGFKVVGRRCVKCGLTEPSEREANE